jgi:hypothetical protein
MLAAQDAAPAVRVAEMEAANAGLAQRVARLERAFIQICACFPGPVKIWVNGHE